MVSNNFRELYQSAINFFRKEEYSSALLNIDLALSLSPDNYQALHLKGLILKKIGNYNEALDCYSLAIRNCNDSHKKEKIKTLYESLRNEIDGNLELINNDNLNKTNIEKTHAHEKFLDNNKILNLSNIIQEKIDNENYEEAIFYLNQVISLISKLNKECWKEEELDNYYFAKAYAFYNLNNLNRAKSCLNRALQINPDNSDAFELYSELSQNTETIQSPTPSEKPITQFSYNSGVVSSQVILGIIGLIVFIAIIGSIITIVGSGSSSSFSSEIRSSDQLGNPQISPKPDSGISNKEVICERIVRQYADSHDYQLDTYDCDDMAMDVWNMLQKEGINSELVIGDVEKDVQYPWEANHAWVLAEIDPNHSLALEATGGFVERENPLYYEGWFFKSPLELKEYRELQNVYESQVDKYNKAIDEYNQGVDQFNQIDDYDSGQYLQAGIEFSSANSVLQERYNDLAETQNRMMELLQGHSLSSSDSTLSVSSIDVKGSSRVVPNTIPTIIPSTPSITHSGDLVFASTLLESGKLLETSRINILNKANRGDYVGVLNEIAQLEINAEQYSNQIKGLDLSSHYWTYRDYVVEGFDNYKRGCRDFRSAVNCYEKGDMKTYNEMMNQALGEFSTGNTYFSKAETELEKIS